MVAGDFWYTEQGKEFAKERERFAEEQALSEAEEKIQAEQLRTEREALEWSVSSGDTQLYHELTKITDPQKMVEIYLEWKRVIDEESSLGHSLLEAQAKAKATVITLLA